MKDKSDWIWLSQVLNGYSRMTKLLLERYKTPKEIKNTTKEELEKLGLEQELIKRIKDEKYKMNLEKYMEYMEREQIEFICREEIAYPEKLKKIYDSPLGIYVKGNKNLLQQSSIAIIGCRECSNYGKDNAKRFARELAKEEIVIISGLAKGIDTCAHIGCLEGSGKTIAVLGNGLERVYPNENHKLAEIILKNEGLIVSEYPIGSPIKKINFPARNRIISALSNGILVVEAKEKSGTFITVDFGLEQGKNIFAIPGNISSIESKGTNKLIQEGAKLVTNTVDILEEYVYTRI